MEFGLLEVLCEREREVVGGRNIVVV